jgi:ABC-2 type transport system permease protein
MFAVSGLFLRRFAFHPMNLAGIFLMPIVIALIFGAADDRALSQIPIGVYIPQQSASATAFVHTLDKEPGVTIREYGSMTDLLRAIRRVDVSAAIVVPASLDNVEIMGDSRDPVYPAARAIVASTLARGDAHAAPASVHVDELATTAKSRETGIPRAAAGMLIFFMFVNACFASAFLIEDRARGVFARMASSPVPANVVVGGEVIGRFGLAFVQGALIAVVSSLLLGAEWGAIVPFALVLAALSVVAAGTSVLLGVLVRRPGPQAATVTLAVAAVWALVGGCFWSLNNVPTTMQVLALATPDAWALRAIDALVARGAGVTAILGDLAVLFGVGIVFLGLATYELRRSSLMPRGMA